MIAAVIVFCCCRSWGQQSCETRTCHWRPEGCK